MKKISIFSREYERKIRRKRFSIVSIVIIFSVLIVVYIINFSNVNDYVKKLYDSTILKQVIKNKDDDVINEVEDNKDIVIEENKSNDKISNIEEETFLTREISLSDSEVLNVVYSMNNDLVEFESLGEQVKDSYKFDVSPNKSMIIIDDYKNQNSYLVDSQFNVHNLDPEFFYSNSAKSKFYKNDVISQYENYAWYRNPKFISDDTIVYVSNLPWFGKNEEYVWKSDVSNLNDIKHFMTPIGGQNIDFMELTEEGIKVNINNEIKLLTFSFVLK